MAADPIRALNLFLLGELGRPPTIAEVKILRAKLAEIRKADADVIARWVLKQHARKIDLRALAAKERPELLNDPDQLITIYIQGKLSRKPDRDEQLEIVDLLIEGESEVGIASRMFRAIAGREGITYETVYQIYTKEFLDAFEADLRKRVLDFHEHTGRWPRVVEVAAGDGRFARALNKRLAAHPLGNPPLRIRATDFKMWGRGADGIRFSEHVEQVDGFQAAQKGDIVIGSWWHHRDSFDARVAQHIAKHPEKTLILVEPSPKRSINHTEDFWTFVDNPNNAIAAEQPTRLNQTPDGEKLPYCGPMLNRDRDTSQVTVYRRRPSAPAAK